jgi:hypothetical protein
MNPPPPTPPRSNASRLDADADAELTWPPPEDARFATSILDLQKRRVISIQEAATDLDLSPPTDRAEPRVAPAIDSAFIRSPRSVAAPAAVRDAPDGPLERRQTAAPARRFSPRPLMAVLTFIVIVQAIAIVTVLVRGRPARTSEPVPVVDSPAVQLRDVAPAQPANPRAAFATESSAPDRLKPDTPAAATEGRLLIRSDPAGAAVVIDGRRRGTTPLALDGLAPGPHRVKVGSAGASLEQVVAIEAGSTTTLVVPMTNPAANAGWLSIAAPIALQIFDNGRLLGTAAEGPLRVAAGTHRLELMNEPLGYRLQQEVTVRAGEVARVHPSIPDGVLNVNAEPWANVWVDGEPVGETPLGNIKIALGQHEVRFRHPSFGEQVRQVIVSAREPARVSVSMKP